MSGEITTKARGHLGADPELKTTPNGYEVAEFSVGVSVQRRVPGAAGQPDTWEDVRTDWLRCAAWGRLAKDVISQLRKGMLVEVTGRLTPSSYLTKEAGETGEREPRVSLDVSVDSVTIVPRAPREGGGTAERLADAGADTWSAPAAAGAPF